MRGEEYQALSKLAESLGALVVHMDRQTQAAEKQTELLDELCEHFCGEHASDDDDDDDDEPKPAPDPMEKVGQFAQSLEMFKAFSRKKPTAPAAPET